mmetsp:Transcript_11507/g.14331  ORF Transcript_11507/g.14331 Transcript_11507/m.14331 type:complete len:84 (-) Transcript_11507:195-446(-)
MDEKASPKTSGPFVLQVIVPVRAYYFFYFFSVSTFGCNIKVNINIRKKAIQPKILLSNCFLQYFKHDDFLRTIFRRIDRTKSQ